MNYIEIEDLIIIYWILMIFVLWFNVFWYSRVLRFIIINVVGGKYLCYLDLW